MLGLGPGDAALQLRALRPQGRPLRPRGRPGALCAQATPSAAGLKEASKLLKPSAQVAHRTHLPLEVTLTSLGPAKVRMQYMLHPP